MIDTAWSICSWETSLPPSTTGSRMIWVPPSRSSASFGVQLVPAVIAPTRFRPRRTTMIAPSQARERQAFRTGLGDFAKAGLSFLVVQGGMWPCCVGRNDGSGYSSTDLRGGAGGRRGARAPPLAREPLAVGGLGGLTGVDLALLDGLGRVVGDDLARVDDLGDGLAVHRQDDAGTGLELDLVLLVVNL